MSGWHDREARNQALFREANEQTERLPRDPGADALDQLVCECGNPDCAQRIRLTRVEYERVRAYASRFAVALNHENPAPDCPVTVHTGAPRPVTKPYVVKVSTTDLGQCAAVVVRRWDG